MSGSVSAKAGLWRIVPVWHRRGRPGGGYRRVPPPRRGYPRALMAVMSDPARGQVAGAIRATYAAFIATGIAFASWASRIPQVKTRLDLGPSELGLVLLAI